MHLIGRLLSYLLLGPLMPFLLLHPKLKDGIRRRFGLYDGHPSVGPWPPSRGDGPRIWLHGASAGDLLALKPIIAELRRRSPEATLIVSTMTNSGYAIAESKLASLVDAWTFVPYDLPGATRRTVAALQPDLLVLEYTEIWPNLIDAASRGGAKVALTNGRFNEKILWQYRWLYRLIGNPLSAMSLLLMREQVEAEKVLALGAPDERVAVTGNTKFDNVAVDPDPTVVERLDALMAIDGPVFVAGSTHDGEERGVIGAFLTMRAALPELRMIIAPRYTERGAKVAAIGRQEGLSVALRSETKDAGGADLLVLDTIGELIAAYRLGTLVFVGGSFVKRGGQNILEPAGQGKPVLFGPNMANFRDSVEVLLGRGGISVDTTEQLGQIGADLLLRPDELNRLGTMAKDAVQKVRGASAKNAQLLLDAVAQTTEVEAKTE